jgi:hypothetical protein
LIWNNSAEEVDPVQRVDFGASKDGRMGSWNGMIWIKALQATLFDRADNDSRAGAHHMEAKRLGSAQIETALQTPSSIFAAPEDVLEHDELTRQQKVEILWRWEYDAAERSVAVEEGMPGEDGDLLGRIMLALGALGAAVDVDRTGPSKQHGLPRPTLAKKG